VTLSPSVLLAPHFTAHELGADIAGIPAAAEANLYKVATWLEAARSILGVPLTVTSGYRPLAHNAAVGGSSTSDHPNGLAADFKARGMWAWPTVYDKLRADMGRLPSWDQLIFYPVTGHVHVGLGSRMRREFRIALAEGGYPLITPTLETQIRGSLPVLFVLVLVAATVYVVAQKA
jgi:hypothetical protein